MDTDKFLRDYLLTYKDQTEVKKRLVRNILILALFLFIIGIYFKPLTNFRERIEYNAAEAKKENINKRKKVKLSDYFSVFSNDDVITSNEVINKEGNKKNLEYKGKYPMPIKGTVTSRFGYRVSPFNSAKSDFHSGIDISGYVHHAEVSTIENGTVVFSGVQRGYGNCILIKHGPEFYTMYAHLSKRIVGQGENVERGQVIALEGGGKGDPNPGYSTGHHLHFEVRRNENMRSAIDPAPFIF